MAFLSGLNINSYGQKATISDPMEKDFRTPPNASKPWVFWYWMKAAVSKEGIAADIKAMRDAHIDGAYLMPIKGLVDPPLYTPAAPQLSKEWWELVRFAMSEAQKNGIKIAMHDCDGFALAGGPWITPENSMQKVTWNDTIVDGNRLFDNVLSTPQHYEEFYKDIAVFAIPVTEKNALSSYDARPKITSSLDTVDASFLSEKGNRKSFASKENCWIQYEFSEPFTSRSLVVKTSGNNYQAHRLTIEASQNGKDFFLVRKLQPARSGWQDTDADYTFALPQTTAKYFRFVYDPAGSEPGAEDLDAAKWKQSLKLNSLELSSDAKIDQYEGKSGSIWRIAANTTEQELPASLAIPMSSVVNLTSKLDTNGKLYWQVPAGRWRILRMGHTSTGHTNATGGSGSGLECDKFNPEIVQLQYQNWYGEIIKHIGPNLSAEVLKGFHVDSWECGSQNWSSVFVSEFQKRRGYDPIPFLPAMAGFPIGGRDSSERFLHDMRQTIADLVNDVFFKTMAKLAHVDGKFFSAESVAPVMLSDGMRHYGEVDVPMGEFWLRSPTHDKPNDMMDAISGAHIYGKTVIQAEGFTELRMAWDEHPAMLKKLLDRNYALGINRLVFHVFSHNPWMDRKPGMTLDGIGLYFQRNQTWWPQAKAFTDYVARSQSILQKGVPVVDIAVFVGEDLPNRSVLPDRLVHVLPGLFGKDRVEEEDRRKENKGLPLRKMPKGVTASANITDWGKWINPLKGYSYDAINRDALLRLAKVENGNIVLPGGASYKILVLPDSNALMPNDKWMTPELIQKIYGLLKDGATILMGNQPLQSPSLSNAVESDATVKRFSKNILAAKNTHSAKLYTLPFQENSFAGIGVERDIVFTNNSSSDYDDKIAYSHRVDGNTDVYFISNQDSVAKDLQVSCRVAGRVPEIWDAVAGTTKPAAEWKIVNGRTVVAVHLNMDDSKFIVFRKKTSDTQKTQSVSKWNTIKTLDGAWNLTFDASVGGPKNNVVFARLKSWTTEKDSAIRFYSGQVVYKKTFVVNKLDKNIFLNLGNVANIASIKINGKDCGIAWRFPYRLDVADALKKGRNTIEISVANTWHNRIELDQTLPEFSRITWTTSPIELTGDSLLESGLLGPVDLEKEENVLGGN